MSTRSPVKRQDSGSRRVTFSETAPAVAPAAPPPPGSSDEDAASSSVASAPLSGGRSQCGGPASWHRRFKASVKALKREVLALYYAVHDPRTPWTAKVLPCVALAYALSPLDLIPDFIPVLGFLDDMLLLPGLLWIAVQLIPREVMDDARERARSEPLLLHRNWAAATLVFLLWTALAVFLAHLAFVKWADDDAKPYEWAVLAGTGGVCSIMFATWMVSRLQYERRRRDEWNALLNASLLPAVPQGEAQA